MASFGGLILTNKGRALQAKAQAGTALVYTRIGMGDGNLGGQQMPGLTALINAKKYLPINKITAVTDGKTTVSSYLSNAEITVGFFFRELGLFATDPDEGEILYCYGNAGAGAEYIPAGGGPDIVEKYINVVSIVGNAANVSAIIDNSLIFVEQTEFDDHVNAAVLDHPDNSVTDPKIGNRTADPNTSVPYGLTGRLTQWISWFTKYLKAITGKTGPFDTPDITLAATKTHVDDLTKHITAAERTAWNAKQAALGFTPENVANRNQANGYAGLDGTAKLPASLLPALTGDVTSSAGSAATTIAANVVSDSKIGNRTATDSVTPSLTGSLTALLSSLFTLIKGITGKPSVLSAPAITLEAAKTSIDELKAAQTEAATITAPIKRGLSVINTSQASGTDLTIGGRTQINLFGRDGGCESLAPFKISGLNPIVSSTRRRSGENSIKFSPTVAQGSYLYKDYTYKLDTTKQYLVGAWVYLEAFATGAMCEITLRDIGTFTTKYSTYINTSKVGEWQFLYIKVPTANTLIGEGFRLLFGAGAAGALTAYYDEIRVIEVTQADYTAIGTTLTATSVPSIDDVFPYVDSIQSLQNPAIRKKGKNLLPPFTQWTIHANAKVLEPYKLELSATANYQYSEVTIPVVPSTTYTLSNSNSDVTLNTVKQIILRDAKGTYSRTVTGTFTTNATEVSATLQIGNGAVASGTFVFSEIMIEISGAKTQFQLQNDDMLIIPTVLTSNLDGSVKDTYNSALGTVTRRWKAGMLLDGSLAWVGATIGTGLKFFYAPSAPLAKGGVGSLTRPDGSIAKYESSGLAANIKAGGFLISGAGNIYLAVANSDSGWGEAYNPTNAELIAFMNGWQMNNGTLGTVYDSGTKKWTSIVSPKADFVGKTAGSNVVNPHIAQAGASASLIAPAGAWFEFATAAYLQISAAGEGGIASNSTTINGSSQQHCARVNVIEHIIREYGAARFGSAVTLAERIAWAKANVGNIRLQWTGTASGPNGYKATLAMYKASTSTWQVSTSTTTSSTPVKLTAGTGYSAITVADQIDDNGFALFAIFADASNGSIASVVNTDELYFDVDLNLNTIPSGRAALKYTPHTLDYQLATAVEETIVVEGAIGLQSGGNQIELLEGVVVREKIIPSLDTSANDRYYINEKGVVSFIADNPLKYKADKILAVYRNGVEDKFWYPYINSNLQNGAAVRIEKYNYDPSAEYTVTYTVLDKHIYTSNIIDATVTYQTTLGGTVAKNTQDITDIKTQNDVQDWKLLLDEAYALNTRFDLNAHIGSRGFSHAIATQTEAGFIDFPDKIKIDGIEAGANKYVHPTTHPATMISIADAGNLITATDVEGSLQEIAGSVFTKVLAANYNVNTLSKTGRYYAYASSVNIPTADIYYIDHIQSIDAGYATQKAYNLINNREYARRNNNGTWTPWTLVSKEMINYGAGVNADTLKTDGWYHIPQGTNVPIAGVNFFIEVVRFPAGEWTVQNAYFPDDSRIWTRRQVGGVWGVWTQVSNETVYVASGFNLNNLIYNGKYNINLGVNVPANLGSDWCYLEVTKYTNSDVYTSQTLRDFYSARVWERRLIGGTWGAWSELSSSSSQPYVFGNYTGNDAESRTISLPFTPSSVLVFKNGAAAYSSYDSGLAVPGVPVNYSGSNNIIITTNGFIVGSGAYKGTNNSPNIFTYMAFK
ncbi:phage tail protein [Bacillus sp. FJAT-26390]|uniref:phage tail-collar fiber domain-containing protein n=1 Tax=Bacillus sp. FJAT-26390 TaxID=1743142 RepID=UPI000807B94D|nr:phage tail protein [Bacillus sp. FJAT-26390]OBZ08039.1 hypothetical protein A7975_27315 [Bacillus sp. FJAT-26390]